MTKVITIEYDRIPGVYEPIERAVEHHICDECGSPDIGYQGNTYVSAFISGSFSLVIIVSFYAAIVAGFITYNLKICVGLGMISLIASLIYFCLLAYVERNNDKHLKCKKCGNEHVT